MPYSGGVERQSLNPHDIVLSLWGKRARGQPLTLIWPWESQVAGYEWRDLTTVSVKGNWVKYGIYGLLIINHWEVKKWRVKIANCLFICHVCITPVGMYLTGIHHCSLRFIKCKGNKFFWNDKRFWIFFKKCWNHCIGRGMWANWAKANWANCFCRCKECKL